MIATEFEKEYVELATSSKGHKEKSELDQSNTKQRTNCQLSISRIEVRFPWRHRVFPAAGSLFEVGWKIEARAIHDELNKLPKHEVDWAQSAVRDAVRDEIQKASTRIHDILKCCVKEFQASISNTRFNCRASRSSTTAPNLQPALHIRQSLYRRVRNRVHSSTAT